jgi:hypothetical protein
VEAGWRASAASGRLGRTTSSPPQFGHFPPSRPSAQSAQNVHSKEQIRAWVEAGGSGLSQHSQLGLSSSMEFSRGVRSDANAGAGC